jgi:hypothetical protein
VLSHAMDKYNDAGACLTSVSSPAVSDELSAVSGTQAERVWFHHWLPFARGRQGAK